MKARALKERLKTAYIVHQKNGVVCIASYMVSELIQFYPDTCAFKFAFGDAPKPSDRDIFEVWQGLHELVETKEIFEYIDGEDDLLNPLPVYLTSDFEVIETATDSYGYPNVTKEGILLYNNDSWSTREDAEKSLIYDLKYWSDRDWETFG